MRRTVIACGAMALLVLLALVVGVFAHSRGNVAVGPNCPSCHTAKALASEQPTATVVTTETAQGEKGRDPRFVQQDVGEGDLYRVIGKGLEGKNSKEYTDDLLKKAGHSAHALAIWSNGAGLWSDPNNVSPLLTKDKTYLSEEGIELWYTMKGALTANGTKAEVGEAPSNGTNSGVHGGTFGQASRSGIGGNRKAVIYTFRNGSKLIIMIRCGNVVFLIVKNLPVVPTDQCFIGPLHRPPAAIDTKPLRGRTPGYTPGSHEDQSNSPQGKNHSGEGESGTGNPPPGRDTETGETGTDEGVSDPTPTPADPGPEPGDAPPVNGTTPPPGSG